MRFICLIETSSGEFVYCTEQTGFNIECSTSKRTCSLIIQNSNTTTIYEEDITHERAIYISNQLSHGIHSKNRINYPID
jgi:hypothetical protein